MCIWYQVKPLKFIVHKIKKYSLCLQVCNYLLLYCLWIFISYQTVSTEKDTTYNGFYWVKKLVCLKAVHKLRRLKGGGGGVQNCQFYLVKRRHSLWTAPYYVKQFCFMKKKFQKYFGWLERILITSFWICRIRPCT